MPESAHVIERKQKRARRSKGMSKGAKGSGGARER